MLRTAFCTVLMLAPVSMAGDLTPPPGPVAPTMLTLDTMEPRTPITQADLPLSISDEGSYFLTENLVPTSLNQPFLIEINASNVTLDLNGFTLIGITEVSTAADGISVEAGSTGVRIFNGAVRDCSQAGINGVAGTGVSIENVRVSSCSIGVALGAQGKALGCVAEACFAGISVSRQCTIVECTANNNLSTGFSAVEHTTFTTCTAMDNGSHGFSAGTGASLRGCVAFRNGLDGFVLGATSALVGCTSNSNMSDGFTSRGGTFQACAARGNGADGFTTSADGGTYVGCTSEENGQYGFETTRGATFDACHARGNVLDGYNSDGRANYANCVAEGNDRSGFILREGDQAIGCNASDNAENGFSVQGVKLLNCSSYSNNLAGFRIDSQSTVDGCVAVSNTNAGFSIVGTVSLVVRCRADANGGGAFANFGGGTNRIGTVQNTPVGAGPWDNFDF